MRKKLISGIILLCLNISMLSGFSPIEKQETEGTVTAVPTQSSEPVAPIVTENPFQKVNTYYSEMITSGIYSYRIIDEQKTKIAILKIDTDEPELVIPSELDGYKVARLGVNIYYVFGSYAPTASYEEANIVTEKTKSHLKSLIIPKGIEGIGWMAFEGCSYLSDLELPEGKYRVGDHAFDINAPNSLQKIHISYGAELGDIVFGNYELSINNLYIDSERHYACDYLCFLKTHIDNLILLGNKGRNYELYNLLEIGTINKMVVNSKVESVVLEQECGTEIESLLIKGKNTKISYGKIEEYDESFQIKIGKLYTVENAKAISWAKKNKITYAVKKASKIKKISTKKSAGEYKHTWKKVTTREETKKYQTAKGKWKTTSKKTGTTYRVYGKKKDGSYRFIGKTKQPQITTGYKKIKVKVDTKWQI